MPTVPFLRRSSKSRKKKVGLPPGEIVFTGEEKTTPIRYSVMDYNADGVDEHTFDNVEDVLSFRDRRTTSWINVSGVHDPAVIQRVGEHFGLHPLLQEDIASTGQRPKLEVYDRHLSVVTQMITIPDSGRLRAEQVSMIMGDGYLLSFQEDPGDVFDPVRNRIRGGRGRLRTSGVDYLAYALLDVIVDHYFVVLEDVSLRTEQVELEVLDDPTRETQQAINHLRRDLVNMRRMTWPMREVVSRLERLDNPFWDDSMRPFVRDAYDHVVQVLDLVESQRDVVGGLTDLYMTALSNRMNEIMKVLTIIGTIFIPLTFIAGVYGMNFEHMPELHTRWGYPLTWAVMIATAVILLIYFRRKEWI